jgi:hypothetical protein
LSFRKALKYRPAAARVASEGDERTGLRPEPGRDRHVRPSCTQVTSCCTCATLFSPRRACGP